MPNATQPTLVLQHFSCSVALCFSHIKQEKRIVKKPKRRILSNFTDGSTTTAVVSPPGGIYSPISKAIIEHILILVDFLLSKK